MASIITRVFDYMGGRGWSTEEVEVGGSQPGVAQFPFAFDTPGLEDGVPLYTPTVEDVAAGLWLLDAWPQIDEAFDGTSPAGDIGLFDGEATGLMAATTNSKWSFSIESSIVGGLLTAGVNYDIAPLSAAAGSGYAEGYLIPVPSRIISTEPLKLVVSQNGESGGAPVGGAAGSGVLYYRIGKP